MEHFGDVIGVSPCSTKKEISGNRALNADVGDASSSEDLRQKNNNDHQGRTNRRPVTQQGGPHGTVPPVHPSED